MMVIPPAKALSAEVEFRRIEKRYDETTKIYKKSDPLSPITRENLLRYLQACPETQSFRL